MTSPLEGQTSWLRDLTPRRFADPFTGLRVLRGYERSWLRPDVIAGVTVAAYAIPQVMAYAQIAGVPPSLGLIGFIASAVAYAFFGASRQLSVGPESTTALMAASAAASLGVAPADRPEFFAALCIVVGVMSLIGWVGGLGFLADLLSRPVLIGYMAGVALLMIISQVTKLTGIRISGDTTLQEIISTVRNAEQVHWPTLAMSTVLLVLLLVGARLRPTWPNPLFVVLLATAAVAIFDLGTYGLKTVGTIPATLPLPSLPALDWGVVAWMMGPALGIAVVAYTDNVLTGRAFGSKHGERVDANQEFLGLGVANLAAGLFQGFPVSSSGSRTAIGDSLGSKTQVHSLVAAATFVVAILAGSSVLAAFPTAALGALVFYAATRLIEWDEFRRIARFRTSELVIALATTVAVLLVGVLNGILVAIGLSLADLLRRVVRPHDAVLGYAPGVAGMHSIDDYPLARQVPGLVVYRFDSPLFFANADHFLSRALQAVDDAPEKTEWLLLNVEAIVEVDLTSLDVMEELRAEMAKRGVTLALARLKHECIDEYERSGLLHRIGPERIYPTLPTAVQAYVRWYEQRYGHPPAGVTPQPPPPSPVDESTI